jgi:transcriptional regulator with XRE-family HTH domain
MPHNPKGPGDKGATDDEHLRESLTLSDDRIGQAVGEALSTLRRDAGMSVRDLSKRSGVSSAMISRIENGLVSPSLSTLNALSKGVGVPIANLFRHTVGSIDITFVRGGKGLAGERVGATFNHAFQALGYHKRPDLRFEPYMITLTSQKDTEREPLYHDSGCEFVYLLEGEMIYHCGGRNFHMRPGDSLSFDAIGGRGAEKLIKTPVRYLCVFAQRP